MLVRAFTLALAALALASACRSQHAVRNDVRALSIRKVPTPALGVPNYQTSGTYIQVSGDGQRFRAVNAALRAAVLADQRGYARMARREEAETGSNAANYPYPGTYKTAPNRRLVSASSEVVSALIPTLRLYPGGNDGATWIAATIRVPSGARVRLGDLFANPSKGLAALARSVRSKLVSENACVRQSIGAEREIGLAYDLRGFDPKPGHYRYFALTPQGLAIGFPLGQVGAPTCNRVETTVPYSVIRPQLSALGRRLADAVRRPRHF
jgi:hypothetical protein